MASRSPAPAHLGFGDLDFAADTDPPLTTLRVDGNAIGRQAARFLVERIAGRAEGPRIVDLGVTLVPRDERLTPV